MKRRLATCLLLILMSAFSLAGCGKSEEAKTQESRARLAEGKDQYARNQLEAAEATFGQILARYPGTEAAKEAEAWLKAIPGKRESDLRSASYEILGRLRDILDGYHSMYGRTPASFQELDGSDYFFDSAYMAEVVPAGYTVWLVFAGQGYQVWALQEGQDHGYLYDSAVTGFRRFNDPAEVKKLENARNPVRVGNLIGLPLPAQG